ncbi:uncharacterized protein LOC130754778 [Actinidia eriantha]|uniref:uncharacterized protein LOC130754778 n=1 Tax=Actinidia eriantha TaxID=165200 RepID=UPI00258DFD66|nr:uncharacterized protein LOC130754778 [Actinidia eriantha]XP_057465016.1 uncharacterized protein LOC130754778 [Actinidia eriantha]XP_057465017.1 uncharacterized protein LOC130754778 [Actinidia eriantha]
MSRPSLPFRFAFLLSLSFTASYSTYSSSSHSSSSLFIKSRSSSTNPPSPKSTASDLLSLLGTPQQVASIDPKTAKELRSCLKFLVPQSPSRIGPEFPKPSLRRALTLESSDSVRNLSWSEVNELVWWPPPPVAELARLAVDSGGDPDAIYLALDPTIIPVPDVEECKENRCELTRTPYGRCFINEELNAYLKFLFEVIATRGPSIGLTVSLSRFDFFHGHLFLATGTGRLGILFHAKEYPAYDKKVFPHNMGYCQIGSNVVYDDSMNLRNILWLAPMPSNSKDAFSAPGVLVVLDGHPGGIIYRDLIPAYVNYARTIYEEDLGDAVADVNYLNIGDAVPDYQIFIC